MDLVRPGDASRRRDAVDTPKGMVDIAAGGRSTDRGPQAESPTEALELAQGWASRNSREVWRMMRSRPGVSETGPGDRVRPIRTEYGAIRGRTHKRGVGAGVTWGEFDRATQEIWAGHHRGTDVDDRVAAV